MIASEKIRHGPFDGPRASDRSSDGRSPRRRTDAFTLLEVTIVLVLTGLTLGFASVGFSGYLQRVAAQRAAQVFAQDLTLARSSALRTRSPVVVRFYESTRWYSVVIQETGTEVVRRRFGTNADIDLSGIDLRMGGDSILFNSRGIASLSNASGALGTASFVSGTSRYDVSFNAMGASEVEEK